MLTLGASISFKLLPPKAFLPIVTASGKVTLLSQVTSLKVPSGIVITFFRVKLTLPSATPLALMVVLMASKISEDAFEFNVNTTSLPISNCVVTDSLIPSTVIEEAAPPDIAVPSVHSATLTFSIVTLSFPIFNL